jgi:uncharacterized coiled-coil DUF342 family protein
MGLGGTAKKIQKLADTAEKLYSKLNELREQVAEMREQLDATSERVETLERQAAEQHALLEALSEEQGIDPEEVEAEVSGVGSDGEAAEGGEDADEETEAQA